MKRKLNVLVLGCKEWPYGSSKGYDKKVGGGTGKYITNLIGNFNNNSVNWIILTRRFGSQKKSENINMNIQIYRCTAPTNKLLRLPLMNIIFYPVAKRLIKKENIDIIFSNGVFPTYLGYKLKKYFSKKIILISRPAGLVCTQYNIIANWLLKKLEETTYAKADKLVFLSKFEKNKFLNILSSKNEEKAVIISTGALLNKNLATNYVPSSGMRVLFVGRLSPVKNINLIIMAIKKLQIKGMKNISFDIVGSGSEMNNLRRLVKSMNLEENVFFRGFDTNIDKYLALADVFILASSSEGLPNSVLEAMGSGLPCIVTDINLPFPDYTIEKIRPNSIDAIANAIARLHKDKKHMKSLSIKSFDYVQKNHSWANTAKQYYRLFVDDNL